MESDLKPETVYENNTLSCYKYTSLYETLPVEMMLFGHVKSPVF